MREVDGHEAAPARRARTGRRGSSAPRRRIDRSARHAGPTLRRVQRRFLGTPESRPRPRDPGAACIVQGAGGGKGLGHGACAERIGDRGGLAAGTGAMDQIGTQAPRVRRRPEVSPPDRDLVRSRSGQPRARPPSGVEEHPAARPRHSMRMSRRWSRLSSANFFGPHRSPRPHGAPKPSLITWPSDGRRSDRGDVGALIVACGIFAFAPSVNSRAPAVRMPSASTGFSPTRRSRLRLQQAGAGGGGLAD